MLRLFQSIVLIHNIIDIIEWGIIGVKGIDIVGIGFGKSLEWRVHVTYLHKAFQKIFLWLQFLLLSPSNAHVVISTLKELRIVNVEFQTEKMKRK